MPNKSSKLPPVVAMLEANQSALAEHHSPMVDKNMRKMMKEYKKKK